MSARESRQIAAIVRTMERLVERKVIRITTNVTANLIEDTPVDTSWARSNWVPSLSQSVEEDLRELSGDDRARYVPSAAAKQASGRAEVLGYTLSKGKAFVSNNVHYIEDLNDGTSNQAPRAFVQGAISRGIRQSLGDAS